MIGVRALERRVRESVELVSSSLNDLRKSRYQLEARTTELRENVSKLRLAKARRR